MIAGLLSVGCQPVLLGIVPTPTIQLMVKEVKANGGIAITASHNPGEWNALKLIGGKALFSDELEAVSFSIFTTERFSPCREKRIAQIWQDGRMRSAFKPQADFRQYDVEAIRKHHFKVAIDCCNGVGAVYSKAFLQNLAVKFTH